MVDKGAQLGREISAAWKVEEETGKFGQVILEQQYELARSTWERKVSSIPKVMPLPDRAMRSIKPMSFGRRQRCDD